MEELQPSDWLATILTQMRPADVENISPERRQQINEGIGASVDFDVGTCELV